MALLFNLDMSDVFRARGDVDLTITSMSTCNKYKMTAGDRNSEFSDSEAPDVYCNTEF